jgi:hypothetical protein
VISRSAKRFLLRSDSVTVRVIMRDDAMKLWIGSALAGLVLVAIFLFARHDLRGWTPSGLSKPDTVVQPTRPGAVAFTIAQCVPGTIDPWEPPAPDEYFGAATMTVLTCRSRGSALTIIVAYVAVLLIVILALRRRGPVE